MFTCECGNTWRKKEKEKHTHSQKKQNKNKAKQTNKQEKKERKEKHACSFCLYDESEMPFNGFKLDLKKKSISRYI